MGELSLFPLPGEGIDGFGVGVGFVDGVVGLPATLIWIAVAGVAVVLAVGVVLAIGVAGR